MSQRLKLMLVVAVALLVALPVLADDTNTNTNTNVNTNTSTPPVFRQHSVYLYKAQLAAISGNVLTVTAKSKTFTVNVTDKTKLLRNFGSKSNLAEFSVGNILQISGKLTSDATIDAKIIRNTSIQKRRATFTGLIDSVDATAQKFVLKPNTRTTITVSVTTDTKITQKGVVKTFADLVVGTKVTTSGMWDKSNNTLTEVTKINILTTRKEVKKNEDKDVISGTANISITANGFNPKEIKITKGTKVVFTNNDTAQHWPASNPHPLHTLYPGFDALKGLAQGETYTFTFDKVGNWGYHDHLNPSVHGEIKVVEPKTTL
jgi:plastocyanin